MNELQIQYFFAVADCGGYTQAAQDLFVSQPAISKQIAALEEELGVTLFERGKQTRLTESGRLFYDCFQHMLGELSSTTSLARQIERETGHNQRQSIRLAFFIDWDVSFFMLPVLEELRRTHPLLTVELESRSIPEMGAALVSPKFDLSLCFHHLVTKEQEDKLCSQYLTSIRRQLYCSSSHPLAYKKNLTLSDFRLENCIALFTERHPEPCRTIRQICALRGFEPQLHLMPNHDSVIMAVEAGMGYCILDEWSRNRHNANFFTMPLDFYRPLSLYWRKNNPNPAIPLVVETIARQFIDAPPLRDGHQLQKI